MSTEILAIANDFSISTGHITFTLSIIGNFLNIFVFTQLKCFRNNQCAFYLTVESLFSFLYGVIVFAITILTSIYGDDATGRFLIWCRFRFFSAQLLVLTSSYTVAFAAIDQFFSTHNRFSFRQVFTIKTARCLVGISVCIWIIHSIIFCLFYNIQSLLLCNISNPTYLQYTTYFSFPLLIGLIPVFIASFFGFLAFRNVRRIVRRQLTIVRRRLDRQMTAMVAIRVIILVCLSLPYISYRIYTTNVPNLPSKPMEYARGRLIYVILFFLFNLNYTISFYIYVILLSRFRRQVKSVLLKKYWQLQKICCCGIKNNRIDPENPESFNTNMDPNEND